MQTHEVAEAFPLAPIKVRQFTQVVPTKNEIPLAVLQLQVFVEELQINPGLQVQLV
jgi:hypothetical protein